jgi:hypothetical protein
MRMLLIAVVAVGTFIVTMAGSSNDAQAVVVVRRAPVARGAVVVAPRHGAVCRRYGIVGGVRRCVLY